jgi:hypothetical protein
MSNVSAIVLLCVARAARYLSSLRGLETGHSKLTSLSWKVLAMSRVSESKKVRWRWWLTPVVPATQEAEIRRIMA